jgi:hypothetical protein
MEVRPAMKSSACCLLALSAALLPASAQTLSGIRAEPSEARPGQAVRVTVSQDRHQRLRPHRSHGVPRRGAELPDIEVVAINDLLEPDYLAYMLQVRQRARPLQGHHRGGRQHPGGQRQEASA